MKLVLHLAWNPISIDLSFISMCRCRCQFERKLSSPTGWQNCKFHWPGYNSIARRQPVLGLRVLVFAIALAGLHWLQFGCGLCLSAGLQLPQNLARKIFSIMMAVWNCRIFQLTSGLPGIGDGNWDGPCLRAQLPAWKWNFFAATKRTNRCFSSKSARHKGESIKAIYALNCHHCSTCSSCC